MEISFYTTPGVFEFLPSCALATCKSEKLRKTAYNLIFSWGTLNFEIAWEAKKFL